MKNTKQTPQIKHSSSVNQRAPKRTGTSTASSTKPGLDQDNSAKDGPRSRAMFAWAGRGVPKSVSMGVSGHFSVENYISHSRLLEEHLQQVTKQMGAKANQKGSH